MSGKKRVLTQSDLVDLSECKQIVIRSAEVIRDQAQIQGNEVLHELANKLLLFSGFSMGLALSLDKSKTGAEHE